MATVPMPDPLTILCITSYEKGQEFMRECKRLGCRVLLATLEKRREANWPRESLDNIFYFPEDLPLQDMIHAVSHLARSTSIDRIVGLDEFDMETAAALREHMRVPGMGATTMRYFRDKLAMRGRAHEGGIRVPRFCPVLNYDSLRDFMSRVPPPWVLKPRSEASAIGIRKLENEADLWPVLESLGDKQSYYLLEEFVPGEVYHVDGIVYEREVLLAEVHKYGKPPMQVAQGGGIFTTRTVDRDSAEARELRQMFGDLMRALGFVRGVAHTEFIHAQRDGEFYFLEAAARVGGAFITEVVEASSGINLWQEWARIEVAGGKQPHQLSNRSLDYAGVVLTLARQETPDTSAYTDPEIVHRLVKHHHAGLVVKAPNAARVSELLDSYSARFVADFGASMPPREKPGD
jgi:biotin carboxylase